MSRNAAKGERAWHLWCKSEIAVREIADLMQHIGNYVAEAPPVHMPPHAVAKVRRNLRRFEENFSMLVHEQKRKVRR